MSVFSHFEKIDDDNRAWREHAKHTFVQGIDPVDLRAGMRVTISPNLLVHDRSGTDVVHRVVAVNSTHVQLQGESGYYKDKPRLWMSHEHHFYNAADFAETD